jgi:hypothetical protein
MKYIITQEQVEALCLFGNGTDTALLRNLKPITPMTEEGVELCIDAANLSFMQHRRAIKGQQLTVADDWKHHFARAIERHIVGELK